MTQATQDADGTIWYGTVRCQSADEAYVRFRSEYHDSLGRRYYRRLNVRQRVTRVTAVGINFPEWYREMLREEFGHLGRVRYVMLGLVGMSYYRMFGCRWLPEEVEGYDEGKYGRFLDWLLCAGMHNTIQSERRLKSRRTYYKNLYKHRKK